MGIFDNLLGGGLGFLAGGWPGAAAGFIGSRGLRGGGGGGGPRFSKELMEAINSELMRRLTNPQGFSQEFQDTYKAQLRGGLEEMMRQGGVDIGRGFAARGATGSGLYAGALGELRAAGAKDYASGLREMLLASEEAKRSEQSGALQSAFGYGNLALDYAGMRQQRQQGLLDMLSEGVSGYMLQRALRGQQRGGGRTGGTGGYQRGGWGYNPAPSSGNYSLPG